MARFSPRRYAETTMQTSHLLSERRSADRYLVSLPVETDRGPGTTRNVSVSGLYLVTDQQVATGDDLELIIAVPDRETSIPLRVRVSGKVVRVEDVEGAKGAGIAFKEESAQLVVGMAQAKL
jgi:hypothetical protein